MVKSMVSNNQKCGLTCPAKVKSMVNHGQKHGLSWSKAWFIMVIYGQKYGWSWSVMVKCIGQPDGQMHS